MYCIKTKIIMIQLFVAVLFLHLQRTISKQHPDCSDSATYRRYGHTTQFKGLLNKVPWDLSRNTDQNCTLDPFTLQPKTCGECDCGDHLKTLVWYRFDIGPFSNIAEMPHDDYCPKLGHCNGVGQIALVKNFTQSNDTVFKYHQVWSKDHFDGTCFISPEVVVEGYNCKNFILYYFYIEVPCVCWVLYTHGVYTYSLCMEDWPVPQTLISNGLFYPGYTNDWAEDTAWNASCSSTSYPTPPTDSSISWSHYDPYETFTSAYNNPFTVTSTISVGVSYNNPAPTVTICSTQNHTQTFHRVDITTFNGSVEVRRGLSYSGCSFMINGYNDSEVELYLISTSRSWDSGELSVSYYTPANYTAMVTDRQDNKYWIGIDVFRFPTCAVRDPITGLYITGNFKVATFIKGITVAVIIVAGVGVMCVIRHVAAMVDIMVLLRRRTRRRS